MKLKSLLAVLLIGASASAFAAPKYYVGVEGGYNRESLSSDSYNASNPQAASGLWSDTSTESRGKKPKTFANIHAGVLFPVTEMISLGGQLGYSYYGSQTTNETYVSTFNTGNNAGKNRVNLSTKNKQTISSLNLLGVAKVQYQQFNVTGLAGLGEFFLVNNGSEIANNRIGGNDLATEVDVKNHEKLEPIVGLQLGYDLTKNVDLYVAYRHVFGKDYSHNLSEDTKTPPKMDMFGLGINYTF